MGNDMYSVEQVAERLGLHVRTVRGYIRSGRLRAVRIGKQYRIAARDLAALTGAPADVPAPGRSVEVSSIVRIDGVDRTAADRLGTLAQASTATRHEPGPPLNLQTMYDDERNRLTLVILGDPTATADLLRLVDSVLDGMLNRD